MSTVGDALDAAKDAGTNPDQARDAARLIGQANQQVDPNRIARGENVRRNASQVAAAALYEEAQRRNDPELLEEAAAQLEAAGGDAGSVVELTPELAARYEVEAGPRVAPPALAGPQVIIGARGERLIEVPDEVAAELGLTDLSAVAAPEVEEEDEIGELDLQLPTDIAALLEEADEDLDELEAAGEEDDVDADESPALRDEYEFHDEDYDDPRVRAALERAAKAEKKLEAANKKSLKAERVSWVQKDAPHFAAVPQARAARIAAQSGSRREFLKAIKAEHEELAPVIAEATAQANAELEAERARARAEAKAEARAQWGAPIADVGGPASPAETAYDHDQRVQMARSRGGLAGVIKERMVDGMFPGLAPGGRRR